MKINTIDLLIVFTLSIQNVSAGIFSKITSIFQGKKDNDLRLLLPKLLPHPDDCFLIEFISDGSDHCEQMEPVVKRLENDLDIKVMRVNINRRSEFVSLFEACGGNECGNVPFFYNRKTAQAICGATPYVNLRKLGTGDSSHLFTDTPQNIFEKPDYDPRKQRDIGVKDFLMEKFVKMNSKGGKKSNAKNNKNKEVEDKSRK